MIQVVGNTLHYNLQKFHRDRLRTYLEKVHQIHKKMKNVIPKNTEYYLGASPLLNSPSSRWSSPFLHFLHTALYWKNSPKDLSVSKMKPPMSLLRQHLNYHMWNFHLYLKSARYDVHRCCCSCCYWYFSPRTDYVDVLFLVHFALLLEMLWHHNILK